jgi:RNA-directed DNA polymerase
LDHYLKETLRVPGYVRYCDDLLVFDNEKRRLAEVRGEIERFLDGLRLKLHARKTVVFPVWQGVPFLGFRLFPGGKKLGKANVKRFWRRMRRLHKEYAAKRVRARDIGKRIASWVAHARHGAPEAYIKKLVYRIVFKRVAKRTPSKKTQAGSCANGAITDATESPASPKTQMDEGK